MGFAEGIMDEFQEYGREIAILSFAVFSYYTAQFLHNYSHQILGSGTPMSEILYVSVIMAAYAGLGYLLTVALQEPDYLPGVGILGAGSALAVHYASHTVSGFAVPVVGSTMGAFFALGYILYLYLE